MAKEEKQFISLFSNKKAALNVKGLADILDASYSDKIDKTEELTKTGFAPSTLFYGHGECPRYWHMAFDGVEFVKKYDARSVDNMQAGTDAHRRIQDNFEASGLQVECEKELRNEDPPIHCFVDGLVMYHFNGHNVVIEIKTTRAEAFAYLVAKNEGREYQVMQLLLYMYLMNEQYGALLYENKNDHKKLLIPVEMTDDNRAKIERLFVWMRMVKANHDAKQLPIRPYRKNSKICSGCPIKEACFAGDDGIIKIERLNYTKEKDDDS